MSGGWNLDKERQINLLDLSMEGLTRIMEDWDEPSFRAAQIWRWIYGSLVDDPQKMRNLPLALRQRLTEACYIGYLPVVERLVGDDGLTEKVALQSHDGQIIEVVLMRYAERNTVCVSSQIGCPLGCLFCATGRSGYSRNLTTGEITAQVLHYVRQLHREDARVTNVVFMGMGEPMLNLDALWQAILNLHHPEGLNMGLRRLTISTVGIVPGIERMAEWGTEVGLAISLHAPNDALRDQLVPANRRYPLAQVMKAARYYVEQTSRRITFEYGLADGVNDSDACAHETAELLRGMRCHVNLIPINPVIGGDYRPSPDERILRFQEILTAAGIQTTVRISRGRDIEAGCGQLRLRQQARNQKEMP